MVMRLVAKAASDPAAAAAESRLWLVSATGDDLAISEPALLGRNPVATGETKQVIALTDKKSISKTHARLEPLGDSLLVTDLGSTNGTRVALPSQPKMALLRPATPTELPIGSKVAFGDQVFTLEAE